MPTTKILKKMCVVAEDLLKLAYYAAVLPFNLLIEFRHYYVTRKKMKEKEKDGDH